MLCSEKLVQRTTIIILNHVKEHLHRHSEHLFLLALDDKELLFSCSLRKGTLYF